jgi:hypothetical protein
LSYNELAGTRSHSSGREASTADESAQHPTTSRDYSALIILAVLVGVEVAILYVVIALDTPLRPLVQRLLQNPPGVFTLVMSVAGLVYRPSTDTDDCVSWNR